MNAATEVKRHKLTQTDCDMAKYLLEHGQTLKEIAVIIKCDPSTVGKIRMANYDLLTYLSQRKEMNRKTKERKAAEEAGRRRLQNALTDPMEWKNTVDQTLKDQGWDELQKKLPEVPGQMKMDLEQKPAEEPEKNDDNKQMKFQAAMMDKLLKKLDELIDVLRGGAEA